MARVSALSSAFLATATRVSLQLVVYFISETRPSDEVNDRPLLDRDDFESGFGSVEKERFPTKTPGRVVLVSSFATWQDHSATSAHSAIIWCA